MQGGSCLPHKKGTGVAAYGGHNKTAVNTTCINCAHGVYTCDQTSIILKGLKRGVKTGMAYMQR